MYLPNFILLPIFSKNLRSKFLLCFDRDYTVKAGAKITTIGFKIQIKNEVFFKKYFLVLNLIFVATRPDFLRTLSLVKRVQI